MMRPLAVSLVDKQDYFLNMEQQVRPTKEYIRSALKTSPIIIVINIKVLRDKQYNWKFTINGSRTNIINEGQSDHKHAFEEYVDCYFFTRRDQTLKLCSLDHCPLYFASPKKGTTVFINIAHRTSSVSLCICSHVHCVLIRCIFNLKEKPNL